MDHHMSTTLIIFNNCAASHMPSKPELVTQIYHIAAPHGIHYPATCCHLLISTVYQQPQSYISAYHYRRVPSQGERVYTALSQSGFF